jgi:hypothetical protein
MSDNVIKFRRPEKQIEPPVKKPRGPMPNWAPFALLVVLAIVIYAFGQFSAAN